MQHRGFTLLEMIVVLAILGLATAIAIPSMLRGIDAWQRRAELESLLDQIRALPGNARGSGRSITISQASLEEKMPPLHVDSDWVLHVPSPWKVNANGVCEGGEVDIRNSYGTRTVKVASPFCDPVVQP